MSAISDYLKAIHAKHITGIAGEHAYRPALQALLESVDSDLNAVNDAARVEIGMPDFVVLRDPGSVPVGIVEAKDIGNSLTRTEKTQQLKRYMTHGNLILTNYLEFRWYVGGDMKEKVRIGRLSKGKIVRESKNYGKLTDLLRRFVMQTPPSVNSAQELAERLANIAQLVSHFIKKDLNSDSPTNSLKNQLAAFQDTLLPALKASGFADMYAQTLTYGLFAARVNYSGNPINFTLRNAWEDIPKTNPFLRDLFYHSRFESGDRLTWLADSLVALLRHTDMDSILANFGRRTQQTDPVVHFYETFLRAFDPKLRNRRGVYYTPEPVVRYIVRSIDHILKTDFARPDGLADINTMVLDPAAGTGTFLSFVIEQIKEHMQGQAGAWKSYVSEHLLPRIFGFELMMAPYTVAHMNLSMQLLDAGYEFQANERLGIYLTNALEEGIKPKQSSPFAGFIEEESSAAAEIIRDKPIMVVLGNPPYAYKSSNKGEWIMSLVRDYHKVDGAPLGERNPRALDDDYVKFIRFAQWRIEQSGEGVVGLIANNSWLDGPTFRAMRRALMKTFAEIYVLNLHGAVRQQDQLPEGIKDDNVFDIIQGVAIILFVKRGKNDRNAVVRYESIWGVRSHKYEYLNSTDTSSTAWQTIAPVEPHYFFRTFEAGGIKDYTSMHSVKEYSPESNMAITVQNSLVSFDNSEPDFIAYRPFDTRYICYDNQSITRRRYEIMRHVHATENLALVTLRRSRKPFVGNFWVTDKLTDKSVISSADNAYIFPLYLYPHPGQYSDMGEDPSEFGLSAKGRRPNLSKSFVSDLESKLGLPFRSEGSAFAVESRESEWFGPEDVFYYAYAIFHSPAYRQRYAEFLKIDFPRLPLTSDVELFASLARLGAELVSLHLMKSPKLSRLITTFEIEGNNEVVSGHPKYIEASQRVYINENQYFAGVPQPLWNFRIGGYEVLDKWLKDRRGMQLTYADLMHYQRIVVALSETVRIMRDIDSAIPSFPLE